MTASKKVLTPNLRENHVNYFSARLKHQWFDDGNEAMQVNGVHVKETCVQQGFTCVRLMLSLISLKLTHEYGMGRWKKITHCLY